MMRALIRFFLVLGSLLPGLCCGEEESAYIYNPEKMHFVTVGDTECYSMLRKCLSNLFKSNEADIGQIAVFDIGFTEQQREELNQLPFVHVYDVEQVNPDLFIKFKIRSDGRLARGWYSWKPVLIKQALDMFPVIFYLDASTRVKKSLKLFFQHIRENGYLFIGCCHDINLMTTQFVRKVFRLQDPDRAYILKAEGLEAGFQGLSLAVYDDYVFPMYELAKDIRNFEDDGSCPRGFGWARQDQTLFSIHARLLNLEIKNRSNFKLCLAGKYVKVKFGEYIGLKALKYMK